MKIQYALIITLLAVLFLWAIFFGGVLWRPFSLQQDLENAFNTCQCAGEEKLKLTIEGLSKRALTQNTETLRNTQLVLCNCNQTGVYLEGVHLELTIKPAGLAPLSAGQLVLPEKYQLLLLNNTKSASIPFKELGRTAVTETYGKFTQDGYTLNLPGTTTVGFEINVYYNNKKEDTYGWIVDYTRE